MLAKIALQILFIATVSAGDAYFKYTSGLCTDGATNGASIADAASWGVPRSRDEFWNGQKLTAAISTVL